MGAACPQSKPNVDVRRDNRENRRLDHSPIAQSVEQVTVNHWVGGSSPSRGASKIKALQQCRAFFIPVFLTTTILTTIL